MAIDRRLVLEGSEGTRIDQHFAAGGTAAVLQDSKAPLTQSATRDHS